MERTTAQMTFFCVGPVRMVEGILLENGTPNSGGELWGDAIAFTRDRSPGSFDQWFSSIQFDGLIDGIVSLRARDEFVREWVDDHFVPTLSDFIRGRTGWSVQIAWTIDSDLDRL